MPNDLNSVLIFAVKRPGDNLEDEAENVKRAQGSLDDLGLQSMLAVGTYEGKHEIAIVCFPGNEYLREQVAAIAFVTYLQDSILHLGDVQKGGRREALLELSLVDNEGNLRDMADVYNPLGYWHGVTPAEARKAQGSTYVPSLRQHYIAA